MNYCTGSVRQSGLYGFLACLPVFCLYTVALTSCTRSEVDYAALLTQAETHISKLEWDQAIPLLKQYLATCPQDGRAHFQLGRCYLNGTKLTPYAAEGEFRIALDAYERNGKKSLFKENTDAFFPIRCHLEIAKVYMKLVVNGMGDGLPSPLLVELLDKLKRCASDASALDPNNPDVVTLNRFIETFSHSLNSTQPIEPAPTRGGSIAGKQEPTRIV